MTSGFRQNHFIQKLRGDGNSPTIGANKTLRVMAGDEVNVRVNSWYKLNGNNPSTPSYTSEIIQALLSGFVGVSEQNSHIIDQLSEIPYTPFGWAPGIEELKFYYTQADTIKPKAFVTWILYNEQLSMVDYGMGYDQVGDDQEFKTHQLNIPITRNGYLFVYVSNGTSNIDVYFDNLQVTHKRGPILEETHYYPFGVTIDAISSKALAFSNPQNKYKFNAGSEFTAKELNSGTYGLDLYETPFRGYDPQIGRFNQIDPLTELNDNLSPFTFVGNNPIQYSDP